MIRIHSLGNRTEQTYKFFILLVALIGSMCTTPLATEAQTKESSSRSRLMSQANPPSGPPTSYVISQYWTFFSNSAGQNVQWKDRLYYGEPKNGEYASKNISTAEEHIRQMKQHGINVVSYGFMNKAQDESFYHNLDPDKAFQQGMMRARNFSEISFTISYDISTRALLTHRAENGLQWSDSLKCHCKKVDVLPGIDFKDYAMSYDSEIYPEKYDFNQKDSSGKYIYDELLSHDFEYLAKMYFGQKNYLKINGQHVVFIYDSWRFSDSDVDKTRGFARAFNRIRNEIYEKYGMKLYLVGDFAKNTTSESSNYYRDYGYYQHYDAISSWNIYDHNYSSNFGTITNLQTYTSLADKVLENFRSSVQSDLLGSKRNYRSYLSETAKVAYGSPDVQVDFIPILSFSFRDPKNEKRGFQPENMTELISQAKMVKRHMSLSPLAEQPQSSVVYHVAFNQWTEGQIVEQTKQDSDVILGTQGDRYLKVIKEFIASSIAPAPNSDEAKVTAFYQKYLGRLPDQEGLEYWLIQLIDDKMTLSAVENAIKNSDEVKINAFYKKYLGRLPSQEELKHWLIQLKNGNMTLSAVESAVKNSDEAKIAAFYQKYLGRLPDQEGLEYWLIQLIDGNMTLSAVENAIKNSDEIKINAFYQKYLGRLPSQEELKYWLIQLENGNMTLSAVESAVKNSDEAKITAFYQKYLGRLPSQEELKYWLIQLENGNMTLSAVENAIKNSSALTII